MDSFKHKVSQHFDKTADAWQERYFRRDFDSVSYQDRMSEALRLLTEFGEPGMRVLDLGCGAGVQAEALSARGHEVYACDFAPEMVARTRERIGERALVASGERLPFADASFDAVVSLGVIGYSTDRETFLASALRVLRPGGLLIISMANDRLLLDRLSERASRWPNRLYRRAKELITRRPLPPDASDPGFFRSTYHYMDARSFDAELDMAGFERLGGGSVNFGRLRFMGKPLTTEAGAIRLTRGLTRLARRVPALDNYARIYVTAVRKPGTAAPAHSPSVTMPARAAA